jgi:dipeptidyl aminopeptidase/acylaminoacyl peptidase
MWGLIKTPNLYQCGVSFAGVVDIEYMFKDSSDSNSNQTAVEQMRYTIGDIKSDRAIFESVSPLKHADKILAPILLMHGDEDVRVPIEHSKKMMRAMDKYNIPYEWLLLENEGHGIYEAENQKKYYTKLIEFLAKYLR